MGTVCPHCPTVAPPLGGDTDRGINSLKNATTGAAPPAAQPRRESKHRQHWRSTTCACLRPSAATSTSSPDPPTLRIHSPLPITCTATHNLRYPQDISQRHTSLPSRRRQPSGRIFGRNRAPCSRPCPGAGAARP